MITLCVCCVSWTSISSACAAGSGQDTEQAKAINRLFAEWDQPNSPGVAVGVIQDGQFVHKAGYGIANLDAGTPITADTSFDVMSLAKSFTTACAARLFDQGVISPDDNVRRYVPELPDYDPPITVRHLLTCKSGLRDFYHLMVLLGRSEEDAYTKRDVLDVIARQKAPTFEPGSRFAYSNSDYFLLAIVMERAAKMSFRELAQELLFGPLGMHNTLFDDDEPLPRKQRAIGHSRIGQGPWRRYGLNSSTVGPWRLMTTINDMLLWDASFTNDTLPRGRYLRGFHETGSLFRNERCLSAFARQDYRGVRRFWYTGGGLGFHAHFLRFPDHNLSIVAFANVSTDKAWDDMTHTLPAIADLYLPDSVADVPPKEPWLPDGAADADLTDEQIARTADRLIGNYRSQYGYFVNVFTAAKRLQFQWLFFDHALQDPEPLVVLAPDRLRTARGYNEFELLLEGDDTKRPIVRVTYRDGRKETWRPVEFLTPTADELAEYEGEYYSADLESVYRLTTAEGKLFVQLNYGRPRELQPTVKDTFRTTNERFSDMILTFSRDAAGQITGFGVNFDRVRNLQFRRRR